MALRVMVPELACTDRSILFGCAPLRTHIETFRRASHSPTFGQTENEGAGDGCSANGGDSFNWGDERKFTSAASTKSSKNKHKQVMGKRGGIRRTLHNYTG
eukprot:TRINITY_DN79945_c0_g1_i1.p1 TRINITY_DN79945_c0_g1~~TRINITY_DN79945_c0_g1_i1.p1  ORF type:complete len:101 (-),score=5.70 TRINITY_DN79945_c0_g1_i1:6-308(-)